MVIAETYRQSAAAAQEQVVVEPHLTGEHVTEVIPVSIENADYLPKTKDVVKSGITALLFNLETIHPGFNQVRLDFYTPNPSASSASIEKTFWVSWETPPDATQESLTNSLMGIQEGLHKLNSAPQEDSSIGRSVSKLEQARRLRSNVRPPGVYRREQNAHIRDIGKQMQALVASRKTELWYRFFEDVLG